MAINKKHTVEFMGWQLDNMDVYVPIQLVDRKVWMRTSDREFFTSEQLFEVYKDEVL